MVSTTEGVTDNSSMSMGTLGITKKPSARKYFCHFSEVFDVKQCFSATE